ncbi:MGH1-like glycoside hydrolase domain-containing protein [Dactylosporangium sp. NPDC051541]|uniref:MGH1-like glycoside hydrolase domain-containing protein n=1 Tax=Dactylosporangium sp. NPDC051541 TaxID=3363977 RepID=UPI0037B6C071
MTDRYASLLSAHILAKSQEMTREPVGIIQHPFLVPSSPDSPYYSGHLWDWDSWLASVVLAQVEAETGQTGRFAQYQEGCILNFLDHARDGFIPIQLNPEGTLRHGDFGTEAEYAKNQNTHKPVLVQHAALLSRRRGDAEWLRPHRPKLEAFLNGYLTRHFHAETGLVHWQTDFAVGVDNDPSVYYRPARSTAAIYLNSLMYRELLAYGELLEQLGEVKDSVRWRRRAQDLADAIHAHCWDERDGTFYSADLALRPVDDGDWLHSGAPRAWSSLLLRVDNWSSFLPMWAGLATQEQAERMVRRVRDQRTFAANYGIRSLSRLEKMYDLRASNNPSNWLGPIWGITNYLVFRGLVKYGFDDDARDLAGKTVRLFGRDLETTGCLHEFYHPDSGEPIMTRNFQNWNFLVLQMIAWLDDRPMVTEF